MWAGGAAIIVLRVHTGDHRCLPLRLVHVQAAVALSSYTCRREPVSLDSGCACKVSCDHLWCDRSRRVFTTRRTGHCASGLSTVSVKGMAKFWAQKSIQIARCLFGPSCDILVPRARRREGRCGPQPCRPFGSSHCHHLLHHRQRHHGHLSHRRRHRAARERQHRFRSRWRLMARASSLRALIFTRAFLRSCRASPK